VNPNFPFNRKNNNHITINVFQPKHDIKKEELVNREHGKDTTKIFSLSWLWLLLKKLWQHPKKLISALVSAFLLWLASFLNIKLPNLPFISLPVKSEQKQSEQPVTNKVTEQIRTNVVIQTNIVTQTNLVYKTNTVTETKYITNFVIQPIVVTNTVTKEVLVTVTNVLIIKNNSNTNDGGNKLNGPAYFISDDFNTILQNQQQNPIRGKTVN
jgi:hypothetical protein